MTLQEALDKSDKNPAEAEGIKKDSFATTKITLMQDREGFVKGFYTTSLRRGLSEISRKPIETFSEFKLDFKPVMKMDRPAANKFPDPAAPSEFTGGQPVPETQALTIRDKLNDLLDMCHNNEHDLRSGYEVMVNVMSGDPLPERTEPEEKTKNELSIDEYLRLIHQSLSRHASDISGIREWIGKL